MSFKTITLPSIYGIAVIPSEDVPRGYKRTEGMNIFVNPHNYELMRPLGARAILIILGILGEQAE